MTGWNSYAPVRHHRLPLFPRTIAPTPATLLAAALSPATARWAASWADGLITVAGSRTNMKAVVDAFREGGGADKPMYLQVSLSYAPSDDEAVRCAYEQWHHCALDSGPSQPCRHPQSSIVPVPRPIRRTPEEGARISRLPLVSASVSRWNARNKVSCFSAGM